jgi:flagellar hook-length control protein FliK
MNNLPITITTPTPQPAAKPASAAAQASKSMPAVNPGADNSSPSKSFGDVLARHVSDVKMAQDSSPPQNSPKKVTDKLAEKTQGDAPHSASQSQSNKIDGKAAEKTEENAPQSNKATDTSDENTVEDTTQSKKISAKSADDIFANIKAKTNESAAIPPTGDAGSNLPAAMLATLVPQNVAAAQAAPDTQSELAAISAEESVPGKKTTAASKDTPSLDQSDLKQDVSATGRKSLPQAVASIETKKDAAFSNMMESIKATAGPKLFETDEKAAALAAAPQPGAASLASMAATAQLAPATVLPTQVTIDTPVSHDKWGDEFNQKITWLSSQKEQTAELHLNPPQLGPMDVVLKVSGDQATALFTSPHAAVREAVEQALPRLREMLADSGIMLGNATVSDQAPRGRQDSHDDKASSSRSAIGGISDSSAPGNLNVRVSPINRHNGIVDTFA